MDLIFTKSEKGAWVAEFEATADFNLHIERDKGGNLMLYQRTNGGGWDIVNDFANPRFGAIDYDCAALIYPKFIKVVSEVEPTYAAVTSAGEVTEIKSQDKSVEVTANGTIDVTPDAGFAYLNSVKVKTNVAQSGEGGGSTPSASKWTGHADAEGLKAIGWTDEDIAYYQEHGVNWNEEDDEYHKVSEDNKALYGVLTADNISEYADRIVYLPKIDTSHITNMYNFFYGCNNLVAIPKIDTSNNEQFSYMFYQCPITCIPPMDMSKATHINSMLYETENLIYFPNIEIPSTPLGYEMFCECHSLEYIDIPYILLDDGDYSGMFTDCACLKSTPILDASNSTASYAFGDTYKGCISLTNAKVKNIKINLSLTDVRFLSKDSLRYIINNEAATSAITITLHADAYSRLATDPDITAALAAHPNVSLAK